MTGVGHVSEIFMSKSLAAFTDRLYGEWLPSFCNARHRTCSVEGFKRESIRKLTDYDAEWFLRAVDSGIVSQENGFFLAPRSKAKEQIFWHGSKAKEPRPITLWVEPVITIGALAVLHFTYGWPIEELGAQSETWAFDLVGYSGEAEYLACEVKKHHEEVSALLSFMDIYSPQQPAVVEPTNAKERNAYRKVVGIRRTWPKIFWALGPGGDGKVYQIQRERDTHRFRLAHTDTAALKYENTRQAAASDA